MKLTIKKIFLSILAIAVSIAAAVIGMYMIFLAEMIFGYRLLFTAIFMFNPILTCFLIAFMFRKPEVKEPKDKKKKKDYPSEEDASSYSAPASQPAPYAAPQPAAPVQTGSYSDPLSSASADTGNIASSGYDLPGSETYTDYSDTVNAQDVTTAESDRSDVASKLKFWASSSDKGDN